MNILIPIASFISLGTAIVGMGCSEWLVCLAGVAGLIITTMPRAGDFF